MAEIEAEAAVAAEIEAEAAVAAETMEQQQKLVIDQVLMLVHPVHHSEFVPTRGGPTTILKMEALVVAVALRVNTRNPSAYCVESPALPDAVEFDESHH